MQQPRLFSLRTICSILPTCFSQSINMFCTVHLFRLRYFHFSRHGPSNNMFWIAFNKFYAAKMLHAIEICIFLTVPYHQRVPCSRHFESSNQVPCRLSVPLRQHIHSVKMFPAANLRVYKQLICI
jgi:hypothetical protein